MFDATELRVFEAIELRVFNAHSASVYAPWAPMRNRWYADASRNVGVSCGHREATPTCDTLNRIHGQKTDNEVTSTLDQVVISELVGINHNKADKFL